MTQIILKGHIDQSQLDALLQFLKAWGIEAESKATPAKRAKKTVAESTDESAEKEDLFANTRGMWEGRDIDYKELRRRASGIDKRLGLIEK